MGEMRGAPAVAACPDALVLPSPSPSLPQRRGWCAQHCPQADLAALPPGEHCFNGVGIAELKWRASRCGTSRSPAAAASATAGGTLAASAVDGTLSMTL